MISRRSFLTLLAVSPVVFTSACGNAPAFTKLAKGSKVVALGDSLTFGYGGQGQTYPKALSNLTGWQIDNMGVNGDTSQNILDRLDEVFAKSPKLVLFGIGGNDVLQKVNPSDTKANIINTIKQLTAKNIPVVLIAEPYFSASALFGKASDNPIYEEIANELTVPLFANGWSKILSDKDLKSDQIHANGAGYQKFAEMIYEFLQEIGYA